MSHSSWLTRQFQIFLERYVPNDLQSEQEFLIANDCACVTVIEGNWGTI